MICAPAAERPASAWVCGAEGRERREDGADDHPPGTANPESVLGEPAAEAQSPCGAAASGGRCGRQDWRRLTISTQQLLSKAFAVESTESHDLVIDRCSARGARSG